MRPFLSIQPKQKIMNKNTLKNLVIAVIILSVFAACQKKKVDNTLFSSKTEHTLVLSLQKAYGLNVFDIEATTEQKSIIIGSLQDSKYLYGKLKKRIDESSIRLFINSSENNVISVFRFLNDNNRYYAVKGSFSKNEFYPANEYLYGRTIEDSNNGQIVLINNQEALEINFVNGKHSINNLGKENAEFKIIQANDCQGNHGGTGFCQREPGESFGSCYNAESDEFCDSFISCIALNTNPTVPILLATACSCTATLCP
jgi:hypothetical protein